MKSRYMSTETSEITDKSLPCWSQEEHNLNTSNHDSLDLWPVVYKFLEIK